MTCLFCRYNTWASKHWLARHHRKQTPNILVSTTILRSSLVLAPVREWNFCIPSPNTQLVYSPTTVYILNIHFKPDSLLFRFYQLPCQLLPPQSFIHNIRGLFIQRDRGLPPWQPLAQTADLPSTQVTLLGDKRILQNGRLPLFLFNMKNTLWIKTHAAKCFPQMPIDCIVTSLEHVSLEISRWFPVRTLVLHR